MFDKLKSFNKWIDRISNVIADCFSFLIFIMIFLVSFEVVMRYVFKQPTIWSSEVTQYLFLAIIAFGGCYAMRTNAHVNVDIIQNKFSPRVRAIINLCTYLIIFLFLCFVIWISWKAAMRSFKWGETSSSLFNPPVWPLKFLIPIGAFLLLLQTIASYFRNIIQAVSGETNVELLESWEGED